MSIVDTQIKESLESTIIVNKQKTWRPVKTIALVPDDSTQTNQLISSIRQSLLEDENNFDDLQSQVDGVQSQVNGVQAQVDGVQTQVNAINTPPQVITSVSATENPAKIGQQTFSLVDVSFTRNLSDPLYAKTDIWIQGYKGNVNPILIASATDSPAEFLLETTQETITVYAQSIGSDGTPSDFAHAPSTSVTLDGVISAPPPPTIAQMLTAIVIGGSTVGWQFQFNFLHGLITEDIDGYWIYKTSTHSAPTPPSNRFAFVKSSPNVGIYTFQDITGNSTAEFYYVSAVSKASNLESSLTDAGNGAGGGVVTTVYRPSTDSGSGFTNPGNAFDGSATTFSEGSVSAGSSASETWSGFSAASGSPTGIILKVTSGGEIAPSGSSAVLEYSLNSGSTWTSIESGNWSDTTDSITLSPTQDITHVQVRARVSAAGLGSGAGIAVFEIWIEVTT